MPNAQEASEIVQGNASQQSNVQNQALSSTNKKMNEIRSLLETHKKEIKKALPNTMDPERLVRIAITEIRANPKLLDCSPVSLFGAIIKCAQLGLEPGGVLGYVFLVPYSGKIQVQIGYRGLIELGYRSGYLKTIYASAVYEVEEFSIVLGTAPKIIHVPKLEPESKKGKITFFYAVAETTGGVQFAYMSLEEVEKIKSQSKFNNPIWDKHFSEMGKKTAIRRLLKMLPTSSERVFEKALEIDNQIVSGVDQRNESLITPDNEEVSMESN